MLAVPVTGTDTGAPSARNCVPSAGLSMLTSSEAPFGSVVLFGAIVQTVGVALSTVILIVVSSTASREFRLVESVIAGILLAVLAVGVFVVGLQLQLPIWPGQR